jgi:predicted Zn-dependent protease
MNIRRKTVRRLMVLVAGLLLFSGTVALLLVHSIHKEQDTVARMREAAFRAYDSHDNETAVKLFGSYLNAGPAEGSDAEAVYAYGMARSQVPMEGNRHIAEAINLLQKYLDLAPADPHDASHQLLHLYTQARYNKESHSLVASLLAKNPRDVEAMRAQVIAMVSERNLTGALAACHTLNQFDPDNALWQDRELRLMKDLHQPTDQIVAHAQQLLDAHPNDPRFLAVMAMAYDLAGDKEKAAKSIETAATLPQPDAATALQIIALLERGPWPALTDDLIARASAQFKDPGLQELALRRLFERQQFAELVKRAKDLDPKSAAARPNVRGYDAIAQYQTSHRAEGDAIVAALASRRDAASIAWAEAIRARFAAPAPEPARAIAAYNNAMAQDRANPVFPFYLGDAHFALGETDEAIRDWSAAARLSRTWATPIDRISRACSATRRWTDALSAAKVLQARAPGSPESQIAYAIAAWGRIQNNPAELDGEAGAKLLAHLETIRADLPQESDTLPAYAALLSRRGNRDKAMDVVRTAIHSSAPLPETTFEQLVLASRQEHWKLDGEILDAAEKAHGLTPSIAYSRATALYLEGNQTEALNLAETYRRSHAGDAVWQLDDARFRDAIGQPDALGRWRALCDANPNDIRIQYATLSAPCRLSDRGFWKRTIDRVKGLTGPDGQAWQIEQARWVLTGHPTALELDDAVDTLEKIASASPELGEVHRLLAQALLARNKTEDAAKATTELANLHNRQPDDLQLTGELTALLVARGLPDEATTLVDAVARDPKLDAAHRLWAAQTYGDLGNYDAAIKLLTDGNSDSHAADRDALLASLYARSGRQDEAKALYEKLLADPAATPTTVIAAGNFFSAAGQREDVEQCLTRLKELKLTAESIALLQSQWQERQGDIDAAIKTLADASHAHPGDQQLWQAWSGLMLRTGKLDDADKIAGAGLASLPADAGLTAMRAGITRLRTLDRSDATLLIEAVSRNPEDPAVEQTLDALGNAKSQRQSARDTLSILRPIADRYPRFLPAQQLVVGGDLATRDFTDAANVASRAASVLPGEPLPLELLFRVQAAQGDWNAARLTALRWRRFAQANPLQPDLAIAQTYLQQPDADPAAALKQLDPVMQGNAPEPTRLAATLLYCRALIAAGRPDEAADRLKPLLSKSPQWAGVWMELAATSKDTNSAEQWLKQLAPLLPAESQSLQIALADAWQRVGVRFQSDPSFENAIGILGPIVESKEAPPAAWRVWALSNQLSGHLAEADRGWQALLDAEPADPSNRNNLAFVLLLEGQKDQLKRAESLSRQAIAAQPDVSTFYDTLARIEAQLGNSTEAIKNFRTALAKDPNDIESMIGLADALQSQPTGRDEARSLLTRINTMVDGGTPLMQPIRKQLEHVKTGLSASVNPGE